MIDRSVLAHELGAGTEASRWRVATRYTLRQVKREREWLACGTCSQGVVASLSWSVEEMKALGSEDMANQ